LLKICSLGSVSVSEEDSASIGDVAVSPINDASKRWSDDDLINATLTVPTLSQARN
jgi:hypothetical protein